MNRTTFLEPEVISHSVNGDPPRPLRFRLEQESGLIVGVVSKVVDRNTNRRMGNFMYEYRCEVQMDNLLKTIYLFYERDTMKWFIKL